MSGANLENVLRNEIQVAEKTATRPFENVVEDADVDFDDEGCLILNIERSIWRREKIICKLR